MMFFLLQHEEDYDIDVLILKQILDRSTLLHQYQPGGLSDFSSDDPSDYPAVFKRAIPVGTINFITRWLNIFTQVKIQHPIEIPLCLRKWEFLKRKYAILSIDAIPQTGLWFIKDASELKVFSYTGLIQHLICWDTNDWVKQSMELKLDPSHLFQVSEVVDILSEYRVYIIGGKIQSLANYDGNPLIFPDVALLQKANAIYSMQKDYPTSYSMDVMITARGTSIIEIHTLNSTGLYHTAFGNDLPYAYRDGIDYVLKHNTMPVEWSN